MPDEFEQNLKELTADLKRILTNRAVVLRGAYERDIVYYKAMITTHEVTIGQQSIQLKKAQETVEDNVQTILRLQMELKTSDAEVDSLLDERESLDLEIKNLELDLHTLEVSGGYPVNEPFVPVRTIPTDEYSKYLASGRGMVKYPFHPDDSTLLDWPWGEPEAYPYTHPIRDIGTSGKVKGKK